MDGFEKKLGTFVEGCQRIVDEGRGRTIRRSILTMQHGTRYVKIIEYTNAVFCFVDRKNGDVLKAETWSRPARHARGNIFDQHNGLEHMLWTGPKYMDQLKVNKNEQ